MLDDELSQLPERYRVAILLCDFEGKTHKQAAQELGCPQGTVSARIARGRKLLAARLSRRGIAIPVATLAVLLATEATSAAVPATAATMVSASVLLLPASAAVGGGISSGALSLTQGMLKTMLLGKLKIACAVVAGSAILAGAPIVIPAGVQLVETDEVNDGSPIPDGTPPKADMRRYHALWGRHLNEIQAARIEGLTFSLSYGKPQPEHVCVQLLDQVSMLRLDERTRERLLEISSLLQFSKDSKWRGIRIVERAQDIKNAATWPATTAIRRVRDSAANSIEMLQSPRDGKCYVQVMSNRSLSFYSHRTLRHFPLEYMPSALLSSENGFQTFAGPAYLEDHSRRRIVIHEESGFMRDLRIDHADGDFHVIRMSHFEQFPGGVIFPRISAEYEGGGGLVKSLRLFVLQNAEFPGLEAISLDEFRLPVEPGDSIEDHRTGKLGLRRKKVLVSEASDDAMLYSDSQPVVYEE